MKRMLYFFIVLAFIFASVGCTANKTRVTEGAGIGGVTGAVVGGIIGYQSGHALEGAAIGGAVGAGGGAMVGSRIDKPAQNAPDQSLVQITMQQIVDWTNKGVPSDEIISKIKAANSRYYLTADDINYLNKQGVSQRVIETMQAYK
ncbi:MAG: hypothetical protein HQL27_06365 [Candidatus Omnitrophica bacterium]|nr:hypothetical protein [Candidatus Omnitrophota bacterium]